MATATHPNSYRWGVEKSSLLEHAEKVRQRSNNSNIIKSNVGRISKKKYTYATFEAR